MFAFQSVGWSALFYAATGEYLEITRLLIAAGADVLLKDKVLCCIVIVYNITKIFLEKDSYFQNERFSLNKPSVSLTTMENIFH